MRRTRSKTHPAARQQRSTPSRTKPGAGDPYAAKGKLPEPAACRKCGLEYRKGRWLRPRGASRAKPVLCPACQRIADRYPAGVVKLSGPYLREHRAEIESLIRHVEQREQRSHPLKRVMAIRALRGGLEVTTTDAKLAQGIGAALRRAHRGELEMDHTNVEAVTRVRWTR
jgi:NMD protein affecting ribosome stability and mRNA decay